MKLAEISIKRPSLVIVLFTILTLGGLFSYSNLGYELIPKFETNVITIATIYPGASPSEIENTVTKKIEDAVASLENIKKIDGRYKRIILKFNENINLANLLNTKILGDHKFFKKKSKNQLKKIKSKFNLNDLAKISWRDEYAWIK